MLKIWEVEVNYGREGQRTYYFFDQPEMGMGEWGVVRYEGEQVLILENPHHIGPGKIKNVKRGGKTEVFLQSQKVFSWKVSPVELDFDGEIE